MSDIQSFIIQLKNWVWSPPLLILLFGTGLYLTFLLKGVQFRYLGYALKQIAATQRKGSRGDISHFEALMTTLAGAIGTGTIVGVATAIAVGGPGALFWMWITAILGMATKYAESLLAVKYREIDSSGEMVGGPMEYMEKGLGWKWLAIAFAVCGTLAALGTGNLIQVNSIADGVESVWNVNPWLTGTVLAVMTGLVLLGGVRAIGRIAGILVPAMALIYLGGGLLIIILNYDRIPAAFLDIFFSAFSGKAAFGGFAGSTVLMAVQVGVARGVFTTEAGLGISSIAAAAAKTDSPGRQAMINMTGALISTPIVCTITGLVLAVTGSLGAMDADGNVLGGATIALEAFSQTFAWGKYIVIMGLILFAYTTVLAWAYYGEKCCEYLFTRRSVPFYRILFTLLVIPGAAVDMDLAWTLCDALNGLMAIPNLIALVMLSGVLVSETNLFLEQVRWEQKDDAARLA